MFLSFYISFLFYFIYRCLCDFLILEFFFHFYHFFIQLSLAVSMFKFFNYLISWVFFINFNRDCSISIFNFHLLHITFTSQYLKFLTVCHPLYFLDFIVYNLIRIWTYLIIFTNLISNLIFYFITSFSFLSILTLH